MHKNSLQDKKRLQSIKIRFHKNLSCKTNSINNEFHKTIILKNRQLLNGSLGRRDVNVYILGIAGDSSRCSGSSQADEGRS